MHHERTVGKAVIEALWKANTLAKHYSEKSQRSYEYGYGADAKYFSVRKDAIYSLKSAFLNRVLEAHQQDIQDCEWHLINGETYLAVNFEDYGFHLPEEDITAPLPDGIPEPTDTDPDDISDEFDSTPTIAPAEIDETAVFQKLAEAFESVNDHLGMKFVDSELQRPRPTGWSDLPGYVEEGSRVRPDQADEHTEPFYLEEDDSVPTRRHGRIHITDRHLVYSRDQKMPHSTLIKKRPAYTIVAEESDTEFDSINQQTLLDTWEIEVTDKEFSSWDITGGLRDLVQDYPSTLGSLPATHDLPGDIDADSVEIHSLYVSGFLLIADCTYSDGTDHPAPVDDIPGLTDR